MKVKVAKGPRFNKKCVIEFDQEKRRDYVTGFSKRKKERKERAKKYNESKAKKEKKDLMKQKSKRVDELLQKYEEEKEQANQWENPILESSDDEEEDRDEFGGGSSSAVVSNEVKTKCGSATVEISSLGLSSKHFLGVNSDFEKSKPSAAALTAKYGHTLSGKTVKTDVTSQSFCDLVKDAMKKATKHAKKNGDTVSFVDTKKKFTSSKNRKKPKRLVTKL